MKNKTQHTPTLNEIISDISLIAFKWPKETREIVFRAINSHDALLSALKNIRSNIEALPEIIKRGAVLVGDWETIESMKIFTDEAIAQAEGDL